MADQLLFRGGSTANVNDAGTLVHNREIVIDTDTSQIVLGSAKKRTAMEDDDVSFGSAEFAGSLDLTDSTIDLYSQTTNATSRTFQLFSDIGGTKTEKVAFMADGSSEFAGQAVVGSNTAGASKIRIDPTGFVNIQSNASAGEALRIYDNSSTQKITLKADGSGRFAGDIETTTAATGVILKSPNGTRYRLTVANDGTLTTTAV